MSQKIFDVSRIAFDYEEDTITVLAIVDRPNLRFDGINVRLVKDKETQIPLWVAEILEEEDLVVIKSDKSISHSYMAELSHNEGSERTLSKLDSLLYRRVRAEILRLRDTNTGTSLRKLTSIEGSFHKILRLRYKKILNLAMIDLEKNGNLSLTSEEQWLYSQLHKLFDVWETEIGNPSS